jgi:hypothetical protein
MNKKKLGMLALSVGVSGTVLLASGFSAMASSTSGYDLYKAAFRQTTAVSNVTGDLSVSVKDNGKNLFAIESTIKRDVKNHDASGKINIQVNGKTQTISVFSQGDKRIIKSSDSDVYYVTQEKEKKYHHEKGSHHGDHAQNVESVIDALMSGSGLSNDIHAVDKGNGNKEVTLTLSGNQISPVVQAVGAVLVKHATQTHEQSDNNNVPFFNKDKEELKSSLPKLTQDIKIKQVSVKAEINNNNLINEQTAQLIVTGKDAAGKEHEVTVNIKLDLSQFNNTVIDKIDLNGKKVETLQPENH